MKNFIREFFASCFGTIVGLFGLGAIIMTIVLMSQPGDPKVEENSILKLDFGAVVPELSNNLDKSGSTDLESLFAENVGLADLLALIAMAKEDPNIKGIYLSPKSSPGGFASMKKVRKALADFQASGKFVLGYANSYSQSTYYLASAADKLYLHPMGGIDFMGFGGQIMYYKGLMDKLGVKAQIYYAGKFKSATEPFRRTDMSEANRKQVREYLNGAYMQYLEVIGESRGISADSLYQLANQAKIRNANAALQYGMVDALKYKDEVIEELRELVGIQDDKEAKLKFVGLSGYYDVKKKALRERSAGSDKVAVVFAEGSIVDGEGDRGSIGGEFYARTIREIREDDKVKAIVLRVNSGGGSAFASEVIWREIELAKEQGIKVVTSMGDVAASGGYYIASNSDKIFAESNTITGSIGVFGMIPNMRGLYEEKLGLSMDTVKTGKFSIMSRDMGQYYAFNEEEGAIITQSIEEIYDLFKNRVSEGRGLKRAHVDSIAQGRVWLGTAALEIGLVDSLAGLDAAITEAAALANLGESYDAVHYPKIKNFEEELMESLTGGKKVDFSPTEWQKNQLLQDLDPELLIWMKQVKDLRSMQGPQMRLPFELKLD